MKQPDPSFIPTGVFETLDGQINITAVGKAIWVRLCNTLQAPYLLENPHYAVNDLGSENQEALNRGISLVTKTWTSQEWVRLLNQSGVLCGRSHNVCEVFEDPQVRHLGMAGKVEESRIKSLQLVSQGLTLERTPSRLRIVPPGLGEHYHEILEEFEFISEEITSLRNEKVLRLNPVRYDLLQMLH